MIRGEFGDVNAKWHTACAQHVDNMEVFEFHPEAKMLERTCNLACCDPRLVLTEKQRPLHMLSAAFSQITGTCIPGIPTTRYIANEFLITTMNSL